MFSPGNTLVVAYDALTRAGSGLAVLVDPATHAINTVVRSTDSGGLYGESPVSLPTNFGDPPPLVAAVSGLRQEVAFFGELAPDGTPLNAVNVYDFDLRNYQLLPILSRQKFGRPLAVTYRKEDDSYFLLDADYDHDAPVVWLERFTLGLTIERFHKWPLSQAFDGFALTSGADGQLVLSSSAAKHHCIAAINVDLGGTVSVDHIFLGTGPIGVAARKSYDGIVYAQGSVSDGMTAVRVAEPVRAAGKGGPTGHRVGTCVTNGSKGSQGNSDDCDPDPEHSVDDLARCF